MKNKRRIFYLITFFFFTFLLLLFIYCYQQKDNLSFAAISEEFFLNQLEENSLSLHYTLSLPENYQIDTTPVTLPIYCKESLKDNTAEINSYLSQLSMINSENLDPDIAFHFNLLEESLTLQKDGLAFPFYSEPLSPNSGAQNQLPILLAEYQLRNKQDIENYLDLLELLPSYFSGLSQYEVAKVKAGLFMPDFSVDKVISQCLKIMDQDSLQDGSHFLITTFSERLIPLLTEGIISEDEVSHYSETNRNILLSDVAPAYISLSEELSALKGSSLHDKGLFYHPHGSSYYEYLMKQVVGTNRSIPEIKDMLLTQLDADQKKINFLLKNKTTVAPPILPLVDDKAMIANLQSQMKEDFPSFDSEGFPSLDLKLVSPSLANYVSPAFYLTPPIDDLDSHVIYRNPAYPMDSLNLYTTLAHEGYPGHLYQSVYYLLENKPTSFNLATHLLSYSGYVEGWAYYVENHAYSYANELYETDDIEIYRLNQNIRIAIYSLLDIGIHYEGFDYSDCAIILSNYGIIDETVTRQIYEYILEEPTNYPKYYVGYLEMLELQKKARELMGSAYSTLAFHELILTIGPAPFDIIEKRMEIIYLESIDHSSQPY